MAVISVQPWDLLGASWGVYPCYDIVCLLQTSAMVPESGGSFRIIVSESVIDPTTIN